jgi:ketosteroid isomerase-like protein
MAGALTGTVQRMFDALDKADTEAALATISAEAEGIDEISRRWIRGGEMTAYVREMMANVSDVHSEIHDAHETQWGDTGVVTCWLEQDYTMGGEPGHVSAPTTVVLRREDGEWKLALFHSTPLPEA